MYILNLFQKFLFLIILFSIIFSVLFIPIIQSSDLNFSNSSSKEFIVLSPNSYGFIWPIPGYTSISSHFGKRNAPTGGASSFHHGVDIPAPEGTNLIALHDGEITFRSFLGAGGYTITLSFDNYKVTYCHVSPNFIVSVGDFVKQGQVIRVCSVLNMFMVFLVISTQIVLESLQTVLLLVVIFIYGFRIDNNYVNPLNYF